MTTFPDLENTDLKFPDILRDCGNPFVIDDIVHVYGEKGRVRVYRRILLQNIYFRIRKVATDHKCQALLQVLLRK